MIVFTKSGIPTNPFKKKFRTTRFASIDSHAMMPLVVDGKPTGKLVRQPVAPRPVVQAKEQARRAEAERKHDALLRRLREGR